MYALKIETYDNDFILNWLAEVIGGFRNSSEDELKQKLKYNPGINSVFCEVW